MSDQADESQKSIDEAAASEGNDMLKDSVLEYFASNKITLPTDVQNHIIEAFGDRQFVGIDDDTVSIYFKEDKQEFERDYVVFKEATIDVDGTSHVETADSYTYYGSLDIGFAEEITLKDGDRVINKIESIPMENPTKITDPGQYVVCVMDKISADCDPDKTKRKVSEKTMIYIYCPISGEGIDN